MHCPLSPILSPAASQKAATVFDLAGLQVRLQMFVARRCPKGLRYAAGSVLLKIIVAKLAGEDKPDQ